MKEIFTALKNALEHNEDTILATVTSSSGATPRGAGARMLVNREGRLAGTVGGGAVEYKSIQYAKEAIANKQSLMHHFNLTKDDIENLGMICGGSATVHYLYLSAADQTLRQIVDLALKCIDKRRYALLITDLNEVDSLGLALYVPATGKEKDIFLGYPAEHEITKALLTDKSLICCRFSEIEIAGHEIFAEELVVPGLVYIFGGGHVGQALVPALAAVDFAPVVLDDRAEFVDPKLFPLAYDVRLCDLNNIFDTVTINERDYVCIMTRGHTNDLEVQAQVLKTPARYIGVIGSSRKTKYTMAELRKRGFSEADLARITAPIGLDIAAETPAEIAVSITAELIQERAKDYEK